MRTKDTAMKRTHACLFVAGTALLLPSLAAQTVYLDPYKGTHRPTGESTEPYNRLQAAATHDPSATVKIWGGKTIYGPITLSQPTRLTTLTTNSDPVTIGAAPITQTTFRCIAYNVRLSGGGNTPGGWADADRASAIEGKYEAWGAPDFA